MIRIKMEKLRKRSRAENWAEAERQLLRGLVTDRLAAIDNRSTDAASNALKLQAWREVWERFVLLNARPRSVQKLREQWKRMKMSGKAGKPALQDKEECLEVPESLPDASLGGEAFPTENGHGSNAGPAEYKYQRDSIMNPGKARSVTTRVFQSRGGLEYKRSLLELNRLVKEQVTNCALEEHRLSMQQRREEHRAKAQRAQELHALQCEHERLKLELMRLEIQIRKKQLNDYVL